MAAAADMVLRAHNLQEEINEQYPRSSARNPARLYQLEKRAFDWRPRPMAEAADRLMEQARTEAEAGNYSQARQTMQKALESQQELAEAHRASRFATMARRREFESAWREIQIAEDADRIRHLIGEATTATDAGRDQEALAMAEKAEILNNRILARFPELEMQRRQTGREIVVIKDTAASLPAFQEIDQLRMRVHEMLRQRSTENLSASISQWHRALQQFRNRFPESRLTDQLPMEEATFLHGQRDGIPALLATLHRNLLPIPGFNDLYLYRTEIPQSLYTRLVETNPPGSPGPDFPVESVTWREARDFVRKVGWILAREAQLPTREAHLAAIGAVQPGELREGSWNSLNSSREIQPVGTSKPNDFGFHDLLGNVSEWLHATEDPPGRVAAIGGSSRDNLLRLAEIPEESRSPDERNRFVGFRFTVRMNP
jgi:tetratricopeptide (TPR) repeat protein